MRLSAQKPFFPWIHLRTARSKVMDVVIRTKPPFVIKAGDVLIASGYAEGEEDLAKLTSGEAILQDNLGSIYSFLSLARAMDFASIVGHGLKWRYCTKCGVVKVILEDVRKHVEKESS